MTIIVSSDALACIGSIGLPALLSKAGVDKGRKAEYLARGNLAEHSRYTNQD